MIRNELAKLIEKLEGFNERNWYEVLEAKKDGDCWQLLVRHRVTNVKNTEEINEED